MNKKVYIIANWKCNKSPVEAEIFLDELKEVKDQIPKENVVVICPSMLSVDRVCENMQGTDFYCGVQNFFNYDGGAFTGEISLSQVMSMNVTFTLIGHSERREYFGETDEIVNIKVREALLTGLIPVVCVGETLEERQEEKTSSVITNQVREAIKDVFLSFIPCNAGSIIDACVIRFITSFFSTSLAVKNV